MEQHLILPQQPQLLVLYQRHPDHTLHSDRTDCHKVCLLGQDRSHVMQHWLRQHSQRSVRSSIRLEPSCCPRGVHRGPLRHCALHSACRTYKHCCEDDAAYAIHLRRLNSDHRMLYTPPFGCMHKRRDSTHWLVAQIQVCTNCSESDSLVESMLKVMLLVHQTSNC